MSSVLPLADHDHMPMGVPVMTAEVLLPNHGELCS